MSITSQKTDNVSLASKVAIRRWLLSRMGLTSVNVLDTCAGAGHVWKTMAQHLTIAQWVRCDIKPRQAGTLKMSATDAIRTLPVHHFDVIDIDPYGEPWEPYRELLKRLSLRADGQQPPRVAVFLTHGHVAQSNVASVNLQAVGIPATWNIPRTTNLSAYVAKACLEQTWCFARIEYAATVRFPRVTYYALALTPLTAKERRRG